MYISKGFFVPGIFAFLLLFCFSQNSRSQTVITGGNVTEASSQLIFYYDQDAENGASETNIQVTNINDTTGVWIHVQIFRNDDPDNNDATPNLVCDERDFVDFLTPNDTHIYQLDQPSFIKNVDETGENTSISVVGTKGFVVITPVVSESDFTAISFQYMIGMSFDATVPDGMGFIINAVGRDAVDFSTGKVVDLGTPLDGTTNGFVLLQPGQMLFDFIGTVPQPAVDVVGFVFKDVYGDPGLLGYQVLPGESTWSSFQFDFKEDPTSCGNKQLNCFATFGLNDSFVQNNTNFTEDVLCSGSETPPYPGFPSLIGWTQIVVSGLEPFENQVGLFINRNGEFEPRTLYSTKNLSQVSELSLNSSFGGGWMYTDQ